MFKRKIYQKEYYKRIDGIISEDFHNKTITIVGIGAGSYLVEKISRLGPKIIRICDFDVVEISNLTRTSYAIKDIGKLKVSALKKRIKSINPFVKIECFNHKITNTMKAVEIEKLFENSDIIIAGTDNFEAQAKMNEISLEKKIPIIFIGIHKNAEGGRIIWSIPKETPCYRCASKERYEANEQDTNIESGLGAIYDCQFIDMIALKICIAILERNKDSAIGTFFKKIKNRTEVVIRCSPSYEWGNTLWDAILSDIPKTPKDYAKEIKEEVLLALDTLWFNIDYDPKCPYRCKTGG